MNIKPSKRIKCSLMVNARSAVLFPEARLNKHNDKRISNVLRLEFLKMGL